MRFSSFGINNSNSMINCCPSEKAMHCEMTNTDKCIELRKVLD